MPDDRKPTLPPDFFRALSRELLAEPLDEKRLGEALADAFESGMASTLTSVVSAIDAAYVPEGGFVLFRVPKDLPSTAALRADLEKVAAALAVRLGYQPIILVVPDEVRCEVVDFVPPGQCSLFESPLRQGRRIVALDQRAIRDRIIDKLPDDVGTVSVLAVESIVQGNVATHTLRVIVPADLDLLGYLPGIRRAVEVHAQATAARLDVLILRDGAFAPAVIPAGDWATDDSAHFVAEPK